MPTVAVDKAELWERLGQEFCMTSCSVLEMQTDLSLSYGGF